MIHITQDGWDWNGIDVRGECHAPDVWHCPAERISELLGPDGEPLRVPYQRNRIGFDLTPRGKRA